jgi:hypothetical protein
MAATTTYVEDWDRRRLDYSSAPAVVEARKLLKACAVGFDEIHAADHDSILFSLKGRVMTGWVRVFCDRIELTVADGFQAVKLVSNPPRYWYVTTPGAPEFEDDEYIEYDGKGAN